MRKAGKIKKKHWVGFDTNANFLIPPLRHRRRSKSVVPLWALHCPTYLNQIKGSSEEASFRFFVTMEQSEIVFAKCWNPVDGRPFHTFLDLFGSGA